MFHHFVVLRRGCATLHPCLLSFVPTGLGLIYLSLRDWVVAAATPRVTRQDSFEGEPAAFEEAVFLDGFDAIVGTRRDVATALA